MFDPINMTAYARKIFSTLFLPFVLFGRGAAAAAPFYINLPLTRFVSLLFAIVLLFAYDLCVFTIECPHSLLLCLIKTVNIVVRASLVSHASELQQFTFYSLAFY